MPEAVISETPAPCPKCRGDMALAVITPHPIATQLARHTYLCTTCNQTKTYVLPFEESDGDDTRHRPDNAAHAPHTIPCTGICSRVRFGGAISMPATRPPSAPVSAARSRLDACAR